MFHAGTMFLGMCFFPSPRQPKKMSFKVIAVFLPKSCLPLTKRCVKKVRKQQKITPKKSVSKVCLWSEWAVHIEWKKHIWRICANEHKYITELCDYIKIAVGLCFFFFSLIYFCPSWETWLSDRFSRIYPHKNQQMTTLTNLRTLLHG